MKRSTVTYASIFGVLLLASQALAAGNEPLCYSTGSLENVIGVSTFPGISESVVVKVLNNNNSNPINATLRAWALDARKRQITLCSASELQVAPDTAGMVRCPLDVLVDDANIAEYEIQVKLEGTAPSSVLLSAFGQDRQGKPVAAHRLVHTEWTRIACADFDS